MTLRFSFRLNPTANRGGEAEPVRRNPSLAWLGRAVALMAILSAAVWSGRPGFAQDRLRKSQLKNGSEVRAAFVDVVSRANRSVVAVLVDGRPISLGTIVSEEGLVLTKASELGEHVHCRLHDRREFEAEVVAIHDRYDVALLKIEAPSLTPIEWAEGRDPRVGQWLATPGMDEEPLAVGIVSVARRAIPPEKGTFGVQLSEGTPGPWVTHVVPNSAASRAGVQTGDMIVRAADQSIHDALTFEQLLRKYAPGDTVNVVVLRDGHEVAIRGVLTRQQFTQMTHGYLMNRMSGRMSQRRAGFPQAIQHDTVLDPEMCGGPVVDLSGRAIGLNIARAGRVETFAIPADVAKSLIREMRTSGTPPTIRHAASTPLPEPEPATGR